MNRGYITFWISWTTFLLEKSIHSIELSAKHYLDMPLKHFSLKFKIDKVNIFAKLKLIVSVKPNLEYFGFKFHEK